jgi:pilus assembly protein CpaB
MPHAHHGFRTILLVAIFIGLVAVLGAFKALQATGYGARHATRPVVVAVREIPQGSVVQRDAVTTVQWSAPTMRDAFATIDSVIGRVTRAAVLKGEPLAATRLAPVGSAPGLRVMIAVGKRAMAVRVDDAAVMSGLIQPNSRVDVLVTLRGDATGRREVARVFMENMRVLAVGRHIERGGAGEPIDATTATLEVAPEEAERLAVAMNQGTIELVLRGYGDPSNAATSGASSGDVLAQLRNTRNGSKPPASETRSGTPRPAPAPPPSPDSADAVQSALAATLPPGIVTADRDSMEINADEATEIALKKLRRTDSAAAAVRKP